MPAPGAARSHWALLAELLLLFVLLPLAFRFKPFPFPPIPAPWLLACYCLYRLYHDAAFDRRRLWNQQILTGVAPQILRLLMFTIGPGQYFYKGAR